MSWLRKLRRPVALTGVSRTLNASHRDQQTGDLHGHTWEVKAWFLYDGTDVGRRKLELDRAVQQYEHTCLPDELAWAEPLAAHICVKLNGEYGATQPCFAVEVNRPMDGIFARWVA